MPEPKVSILLAIKNSPQNLRKILQYYAMLGFKGILVIFDASTPDLCKTNQQVIQSHRNVLKIVYHGLSDCIDFEHGEDIPMLMSMVTTPYAVYSRDNEMIVPKTVMKCCEFLESHRDYSAAGGNIIHMSSGTDGSIKQAWHAHSPNLDHEDALERLYAFMQRPHALTSFVFKTELWLQALQDVKLGPNDYFMPSAMLLLQGKIKQLECLHLILLQNEDEHVDSAFFFKNRRHWPLHLKTLQETVISALMKQGVVSHARQEAIEREFMCAIEKASQADEYDDRSNILSSLLHHSNPFYSDFMQVYSFLTQDNAAAPAQTFQKTSEKFHIRPDIQTNTEEAALLNQQGEELFNKGDITAALEKFNSALIVAPYFVATYSNLGAAYWQTGQLQKSLDCLTKGFAIDPDNRDLIINLGKILSETGQTKEAKDLYEIYLKRHSDDSIILDAYSSLIRKINIIAASDKAAPKKEKYSCLFINVYYQAFMAEHYGRNPGLAHDAYQKQKESLHGRCFGDCDFYSEGLKAAAWNADDLIINCWPLQQAWAKENGYAGEGLSIAIEQIRRTKPDVVYLQDLSVGTKEFLSTIRPYTKLIVGQIASPVSPHASLLDVDIIFSSFPHFVERFRRAGITAYYQPLSFETRVLDSLKPYMDFTARKYDATFVGGVSLAHGKGTQFLEQLARLVPVDFWGYGAESLPEDSMIRRQHHGEAWGLDMFGILAQSRIAVNRHIDVSENYANNMRLFEATGCGALLVTDYKDNLNELFEIGKEIVAYSSPEECAALIKHYLANPDEAERIAIAGQKRTLDEHSFTKRMKQTADILRMHLQ